jgi:ribosomal protein S21
LESGKVGFMSRATHVKVTSRECHNNTERMIRRFIKKTKKARIVEIVKEGRRYKKPSVAKKEKRIRAARQRKRDEQKRKRAQERRNRKI